MMYDIVREACEEVVTVTLVAPKLKAAFPDWDIDPSQTNSNEV
jgi:hypothetical protein